MKSSKRFFAALLAVMHVLTFSAPAQQINIQEGTTLNVDSVQVNEGEQLSINVVDQLGQVCPSCRGILETNNFLNNGAIDIWGILAIIAPTIINNGTITVQGDLLLSNLGINQAQFFAGIAELSKDPSLANGYILNTGEIKNLTQGLLALVAANGGVHNLGTISSNGGAVVLAAGDRASFPLTRDGVLNIDLGSVTGVKGQVFDKDGNLVETNGLVTNAGVLQANGGAVVLQAAGAEAIYDSIINHTGIIEAKSVAQENGKIILKSETGNITVNNAVIDASGYDAGEKGGSIELLTQGNVIVEGNSVLDASGDIGGGSILIGSDVGVTGPLTASNVFVGSDVEVEADAVSNGNGGKIIVGAEGIALAYGSFSAKGGAQGGNGGFIETSGKEYLDVDNAGIDASAANGEAGTWLLDPTNTTISNTTANTSVSSSSGTDTFIPSASGSTIKASGTNSISSRLNAGTNVKITTVGSPNTAGHAGDITVSDAISKTAGATATLTLEAAGGIFISAAVAATTVILNVILTAANGVTLSNSSADISTNGGNLTINTDADANGSGIFSQTTSGSAISTGGGDVSITAADFSTSSGTSLNAGAGIVFLKNSASGRTFGLGDGDGDFELSDSEGDRITAGKLEIGTANAGDIEVNDFDPSGTNTLVLRTGDDVTGESGTDVTVQNLAIHAADQVDIDTNIDVLAVTAGGAVTIDDSGSFTVGTVDGLSGVATTNDNITLEADDDLTLAQNVNAGTKDVTLKAGDGSGDDLNQTGGAITAKKLKFTAGNDVTLNQAGNQVDSVETTERVGGNINIADSGTNTEIKKLETDGGNITYNHTGAGDVTIKGAVDTGTGGGDGGNVSFTSSNGLTLHADGSINTTGGSGGNSTAGTGVTVNGSRTVGAGDITLQGGATLLDVFINAPVIGAAADFIHAVRDVIISSSVTGSPDTTVVITADEEGNGDGGVWLKSGADINSTSDVTITGSAMFDPLANGESVRIDAGATVDATGDITIQKSSVAPAGADILINGVVTTSGVGKKITIDSLGRIDTSDDGAANLIGDNIEFKSVEGVDVEINAKNASYNNSTSGNVAIEDMADGLTLTGATNDGSGSTTIVTHSPLVVAATINQAGAINLTALESVDTDDHVTINASVTVQSTAGDVNVTAGDDINMNGTLVKSDAGAVTMTAGSADTDNIGSVNLAGNVQAFTTLTLNALTTGGLVGLISQTAGALTAVDLVVNADNSATLNQATNNVTTLAAVTGGNVTYRDATGLDLKASTIGGALALTTNGAITDSGAIVVNGGTNLTAGAANDVNLDNANDFQGAVIVNLANNVTLKDVDSLTVDNMSIDGALSLTADSDNNTIGAALTAGVINADSVALSGGTDLNDSINLNGDITTTAGGISAQNAQVVNLAGGVDLTAVGGAISLLTNVASIALTGLAGTTNKLDTNSDHTIELANVTSTDVNLTVESDGDVTLGDVNLGVNGDLTVDVDNDNDGGMNGTFGAITANDLSIEGHAVPSAVENFTFNGAINLTGDYDIGGVGILTYNNDVTAKSITIHDISVRVQLGDNVDLTSTNGILSVVTNVAMILLAGANGTVNIFDGNGDFAVSLGAISADNNPDLTINSEAGINLTSANIGTGTLTLAVDNDADSVSAGSFGALTAGTINAGGSSDDNLDFNAAVVANTAGVTISNANNVDFDSTVNTATNLTQTAGSGTTTFSGLATVGGNADITTGAIAFSGATGSINSNAGTGAVKLTAQTGGITSGTAASDVVAGSLEAQSANGIDLDTDINNVAFNNTAGAVAIRNTGALTVNSVGALTTSNNTGTTTVLSASSPLTFAVNTTSVGDLTATAGELVGAGDDLTVNAGVTVKSTTGNVLLQAGDDVSLAATSAVQSDAGSVTLTGGFNDLADTFGSVSLVGTVTAATSAIITALIGSVNGGGLVTAATANIDAVTGIGNTIALNTAVSNISADTTNGNVDINNNLATAVDATSLTTGTGTIDFDQTGGGNLTVTSAVTGNGDITVTNAGADLTAVSVTAGTAAVGDGNVNLTTTTSGNILLETVSALADTATITSAGTIGEMTNDDAGAQHSDVNAGTISLTTTGAAGDIGAPASYLDITPTTLWNATTNGGNIYISCIGVCPMGKIDAGTGTFYYAGNITDGNDTVRGFFDETVGPPGVWKAIDSGTAADWNIRAGGVHLDAANSVAGFIGSSTNWIEMRLGSGATLGKITAAAGTGGIHISNDDEFAHPGLQIGGVAAVPAPNTLADGLVSAGGIEIYSFSPLVIAANVIDSSASSIDLIAAGNIGSDDLTVNAGVTVDQQGSGTVRLFAGDDINLNGTALVQSTTGTISANAGEDFTDATVDRDGTNGGSLVMNSNSAFRSQDGNINLAANNHLRISEVNANSNSDAAIGDVGLNADANTNGVGRIEDRNGANALNVTGNNVTMNAGSGIGVDGANVIDAIETSINRLTLSNTTSGHVAVTEVSAGGQLDIVNATQSAADTMTIQTTNGDLRVLGAGNGGSGVSAQSGELTLAANGGGANDDLIVNNTVTSTTGKINLDSTSRDVRFNANGDVTATGGAEIEVNAFRDVTMADGTVLNANAGGVQGGIDIDAGRDVTLGSVQTTSALSVDVNNDAFNAVQIDAGGAVIDGGDTDNDIIANSGQTTINAVNGIGHGGQLDVQLQSLRATNTTANDIRVREMAAGGDLNLVGIDQLATTGDLNIRTQNGSLTVMAAATLLSGFAGGVAAVDGVTRLFAQDNDASGADHLNINNTVRSADGKINLDSENDVIASALGDVTAGDVTRKVGATGAEIEVDALGNITMADGTIFNANAGGPQGAIDMDANANITLGSVQTSSNANNAVVIVSQNGQIIDGGDTDTDIVTGATGASHLVAETGIGSANGLETQMGQLAARTETGNIQIFNQGDMTVTSLTDNDNSNQTGLNGGTTGGVQITDPTNLNTGANFIFVTNNGNLTVNNDVSNLDGGDVSLYSFGNVGLGDMNINANIESIGANGNMRVVSGGDMNMAAGTNISTEGNGVASGTGVVAVGAGYDVSGKTRNPDMSVNPVFAADVLPGLSATSLATTSTNGAGSLLDTVKDATANLTMDETARISTEDGQIIVDAQNNFTVGRVDADGNASANGITDGVRGNILAFARNGSILDAEGPGEVGNLDFLANSLTMLAAGTIGLSNNRIEGTAPFLNTFSIGSQFISMLGDTQVEMTSASGNIFLNATGTILLGHMSAPSGEVHAVAGNNILSQGGGETRVTASNLIELIANGIVGTTSNPIHTHLNATPAQLNLSAGGQAGNGVSAAVFSNISPLAINMLNNPPGLVLFNGTPVAGQPLPGLIGSQASLYYKAFVRGLRQYGDFDGNYAADFPGFVDYQGLITSPDLSVDTTGLDIPLRGITTAPRVVPIPAPAVPTPVQPSATEEQPVVQPQVPELSAQEPTPPAVVPIPARAQPSDQATTDEGVPETPAASN